MPTTYRTTLIDDLSSFYIEAGPKDAPTTLLPQAFDHQELHAGD
jgi:hypothetical protein